MASSFAAVPNASDVVFAPWPSYDDADLDAARRVLASGKVNYWTGDEGRQFENEFAAFCSTRHALAVSNGTIALEIALKALGVGPGDEVIVTPRSFMASASCVALVGATPVFADVDRRSGNLTAETIAPKITAATKALIVVHLNGWPCDMDPIMELAGAHGLKVIEDCAQAHGASVRGRPVGGIGHIGTWSFCQDKIISTGGEGGMITTNDEAAFEFCWSYKDHGKNLSALNGEPEPGYRWLHDSFGTNARLTEVQSAIGRLALRKMPQTREIRTRNMTRLWDAFEGIPGLRVDRPEPQFVHACYKCCVFLEHEVLRGGVSRLDIVRGIAALGVPCFTGICGELYREKAFVNAGLAPACALPNARDLGETSVTFLIHPTLSEAAIERTCEVVDHVMRSATNQTSV